MISVVLATKDHERALVKCLAALVPAAADGIVRDVVVADGGSRDATRLVADGAGCTLLDGPGDLGTRLRLAAETARAGWLVFLRPEVVLEDGWHREARGFVEAVERRGEGVRRAGAFRFALDAFGPRPRLAETAAVATRLLTGRPRPHQGLLIHRRLYEQVGRHPDGANTERRLLARLGRRVVLLRPRAFVSAGR